MANGNKTFLTNRHTKHNVKIKELEHMQNVYNEYKTHRLQEYVG